MKKFLYVGITMRNCSKDITENQIHIHTKHWHLNRRVRQKWKLYKTYSDRIYTNGSIFLLQDIITRKNEPRTLYMRLVILTLMVVDITITKDVYINRFFTSVLTTNR